MKSAALFFSILASLSAGHAMAQQQQGSQGAMRFIAIGDTPYSAKEQLRIQQEIAPAIKAAGVPFVVHYGDIKGGGEACSKELLTQRRDEVVDLLPGRVFYTPGDNEWADCDRASLQPPVSELASLDFLRQLFFSQPMNLPESWQYARQPNFPENARWMQDGVMFITVHLVSTNNGRREILQDDVEAALSLVEARDQADRVWMQESFAAALQADAKAAVLVTQADVTAQDAGGPCTGENRINCDAFLSFRDNLRLNARNFAKRGDAARRPVLLVHGDTNPYCMDKDFGGQQAPNLWRLNAWGDYQDPADATVITVQADNRQQPFAVQTLLGQKAPAERCE